MLGLLWSGEESEATHGNSHQSDAIGDQRESHAYGPGKSANLTSLQRYYPDGDSSCLLSPSRYLGIRSCTRDFVGTRNYGAVRYVLPPCSGPNARLENT